MRHKILSSVISSEFRASNCDVGAIPQSASVHLSSGRGGSGQHFSIIINDGSETHNYIIVSCILLICECFSTNIKDFILFK